MSLANLQLRLLQSRKTFRAIGCRACFSFRSEDRKFIFPTQYVYDGKLKFFTTIDDIKQSCDLNYNLTFTNVEETIISHPRLKVVKINTEEYGIVTFMLILGSDKQWKICNTTIFGTEAVVGAGPVACFAKLLSYFNLEDKAGLEDQCFTRPYQLVDPPHSLKMEEYFVQDWSSLREQGWEYSWCPHPTILLSSNNACWLEAEVTRYAASGKALSYISIKYLLLNLKHIGWKVCSVVFADVKSCLPHEK